MWKLLITAATGLCWKSEWCLIKSGGKCHHLADEPAESNIRGPESSENKKKKCGIGRRKTPKKTSSLSHILRCVLLVFLDLRFRRVFHAYTHTFGRWANIMYIFQWMDHFFVVSFFFPFFFDASWVASKANVLSIPIPYHREIWTYLFSISFHHLLVPGPWNALSRSTFSTIANFRRKL